MPSSASSINGIATVVTAMPFHASSSPEAPTIMIPISAALTIRTIRALSVMSANWPEIAESRKNGRMNSAEATALNSPSACSEL